MEVQELLEGWFGVDFKRLEEGGFNIHQNGRSSVIPFIATFSLIN